MISLKPPGFPLAACAVGLTALIACGLIAFLWGDQKTAAVLATLNLIAYVRVLSSWHRARRSWFDTQGLVFATYWGLWCRAVMRRSDPSEPPAP